MRNIGFLFLASMAIISLQSCGGKQSSGHADNVYLNDFESHFGNTEQVQKGKGYSGDCFYQIDSTVDYSMGFIKTFDKISTSSFAKVKVSTHVLLPDETASALINIQIWDGAGNAIKSEQKPFDSKTVGVNKWKEVSMELPLIGLYAPNHQFRAFIFNPGHHTIYMDDFKVEFLQ